MLEPIYINERINITGMLVSMNQSLLKARVALIWRDHTGQDPKIHPEEKMIKLGLTQQQISEVFSKQVC